MPYSYIAIVATACISICYKENCQTREFKERLESDKEFATDFNIYMVSVIGICKEAEQDNMEFGVAMKKLSKEQLRNIVGEPKTAPAIKPKKLLIKS